MSSGELRAQLPLPSELLSVASENRTPLRFLVLAWHPQAGWAWGGELPERMRQRFRDPMPLHAAPELRVRYHLGTREVCGRLIDSRTRQPL